MPKRSALGNEETRKRALETAMSSRLAKPLRGTMAGLQNYKRQKQSKYSCLSEFALEFSFIWISSGFHAGNIEKSICSAKSVAEL